MCACLHFARLRPRRAARQGDGNENTHALVGSTRLSSADINEPRPAGSTPLLHIATADRLSARLAHPRRDEDEFRRLSLALVGLVLLGPVHDVEGRGLLLLDELLLATLEEEETESWSASDGRAKTGV